MNEAEQLTIAKLTIARLTKERDEALSQRDAARRMYCEMASPVWASKYTGGKNVANEKGWDCYEKETQ